MRIRIRIRDRLWRAVRDSSVWARAWRDRAGNVAILFSLSAPLMIAGVSYGVEAGYWYYRQASLQGAADAAAYAAAIEARAGSSTSVMTDAATAAATANGYKSATGTLTITYPYAAAAGVSSVKVLLTRTEKRFFSQIFVSSPIATSAKAIASFNTAASACLLSLDKSASKAMLFSGSSSLALTGCSVMSNSIASDGVTAQGSATVSTECVMSAGGAVLTSGVTMSTCSSALTMQPVAADPFQNITQPTTPTGGCKNAGNGNSLNADYYCGLNLSGTVNLKPGTYFLNGDLKINANAKITGTGVTIVMLGSSSVTMNGNATIQLSAPTSGATSGILFWGDRANTAAVSNKFNGTADLVNAANNSSLTGALYFPTQDVNYLGAFSGSGGCMQVVAKTIQWSGNTSVSANCTAKGMKNLPISSIVRLTG